MKLVLLMTVFLVGCSTTKEFHFPKPPNALMKPPGKLISIE